MMRLSNYVIFFCDYFSVGVIYFNLLTKLHLDAFFGTDPHNPESIVKCSAIILNSIIKNPSFFSYFFRVDDDMYIPNNFYDYLAANKDTNINQLTWPLPEVIEEEALAPGATAAAPGAAAAAPGAAAPPAAAPPAAAPASPEEKLAQVM